MQPDTIQLDVDYLNDGNTTAETYQRIDESSNKSLYVGPSHSPGSRDQMQLYRTFSTKNGNFNGVTKSGVKLTFDFSVPGVDQATTLTSPIIADTSFSIPVGISEADQLKVRQRVVAAVDHAFMIALNNLGMM